VDNKAVGEQNTKAISNGLDQVYKHTNEQDNLIRSQIKQTDQKIVEASKAASQEAAHNTTALNTERNRAMAAEDAGMKYTDQEVAKESERAQLAEQKNTGLINRETARAKHREDILQSRITATNEQFTAEVEGIKADIKELDSKVDRNRDEARAGVAGAIAIASLPQVTEYQTVAISAGVGYHRDASALAVGVSARLSDNVVSKVGLSYDSTNEASIGAGIGWGF
ncbi:MAG: YadA C-terminal domain-containing protein, partial [Plesiomonas shigelloides]